MINIYIQSKGLLIKSMGFVCVFLIVLMCHNSSNSQEFNSSSSLTGEEKKWIEENPTIRAANIASYVPFNFTLNQKPAGFSVEYLNLAAQTFGLEVNFDSPRSWPEAIELIKQGKIRMLCLRGFLLYWLTLCCYS